ncbi:MAG: SCP2 sterol-binding domain-containing protein [Acidimicrobiales bacterium]|nr:SCP2 sterol-binding domain-containing protein [Acidimicrobiales bacterium]
MLLVQFLSDDWLRALDGAARARPSAADDPLGDVSLSIEQVVTDVTRWRFVVDRGSMSVVTEESFEGDADIRLTSDRDTAAAIASGERAALHAFIEGELVLGGDVRVLIQNKDALVSIGDVFARVSAATDFG